MLSNWLTESFIEDIKTRDTMKGLMLLCCGSVVVVGGARDDITENMLKYVFSAPCLNQRPL